VAMPREVHDLHGSAPDKSKTALLLIDVINDFDFPEGEQLLRLALPVGHKIAEFKQRTREAGIPSIYVNDNFGRWQSDFKKIVAHCKGENARGKAFVELLLPDQDDYFVLKPKNSGFYSTTLDLLLTHLAVKNLILTGIAGNNCVFFTANDAYMRDYKVFVPSDCVVSNTEEENKHALKQMEIVLKADVTPAKKLDLKALNS
jgi:nicotinamidase-related amidase